MRRTCWITGILAASFAAAWSGVCVAAESASHTVMLRYPAPTAHGQSQTLIRDPISGEVFVVSLTPERDILGQLGTIDLVLHRLSDRLGARNMLEPRGNWHGMEPFMFVASDLVAGSGAAIYGRLRTIYVPRIGAYLNIEVMYAAVDEDAGDGGTIKRLSLCLTLVRDRSMSPGGAPSAERVAADVTVHGARETIKQLAAQDHWGAVVDQISEGKTEWVALAPQLAPGSDAGSAEDLGIALAYALPLNAPAVLAALDPFDGPVIGARRVCSAPFIEDTVRDVAAYRRKAISAVTRAKYPLLARAKEACLSVLEKPT